jgi:predicted transcriptional regulator YheO
LHPHAEVVLHDLAADRIVAIWNPLSGRRPGDPSLLEELPAAWEERPVQGPYRKLLDDGRELSAVSAVVGGERGLLCINLDRSPLLDLAALLGAFARPVEPAPAELIEGDWRERINLAIDAHCREHELWRRHLDRPQRRALVAALERQGLFATRNAAAHVARALGVSRATVYALRKEIRDAVA